jgi:hypothetical protein
MSRVSVDQQLHGYKGGHHLLAASIRLSRDDQDLIDRLSDLSGPLDPGQTFDPYGSNMCSQRLRGRGSKITCHEYEVW